MMPTLQDVLDKYGKHCPKCSSGEVTTLNNRKPLRHRCLACKHEFKDSEAVIGKPKDSTKQLGVMRTTKR